MMRHLLPFAIFFLPALSLAQTDSVKDAAFATSAVSSSALPSSPPQPLPRASFPNPANTVRAGLPEVVPPKLLHKLPIKDNGNPHIHISGRPRVVLVELTVDEAGKPTDLRIPEPVEDALDREVLTTVGKFRYRPGMLNGRAFPMPVRIQYVVPVGAVY